MVAHAAELKGGREQRIDPDMAGRIGERVGSGLKLELALGLETPPVDINRWNRDIRTRKGIARAYLARKAQIVWDLVQQVKDSPKHLTHICWLLERANGYAVERPSSSTTVNVNVQNVIGCDNDVLKRARVLVAGQDAKQVKDKE